MDIRKTKPITIEKKIIKDNLEEEYQIKTDSLLENRRINESIIFNLVQKIQTFEEIRFSYFKTVTSLTNSTYALRSKIHSVGMQP